MDEINKNNQNNNLEPSQEGTSKNSNIPEPTRFLNTDEVRRIYEEHQRQKREEEKNSEKKEKQKLSEEKPQQLSLKDKIRKRKIKKIIRNIILVIVAVLFISGIAGYITVIPILNEAKATSFSKLTSINSNTFTLFENTKIYDKNGDLISEVQSSNYTYAPLNTVPQTLIQGYISVEDKRFLNHHGIDYKSIFRAGLSIIKNKGKITQGGSTITQQVVKNVFLTQEQTIKRKLAEFYMAPEIEKRYSKDEIMEFYLNTNYYGYGCYGVEAASNYYFNKNVSNLTTAEAAILIGLSNNPTLYNPIENPEKALEKRQLVLNIMYANGVITEDEMNTAKNEDVTIYQIKPEGQTENYQTSYAIHCAVLKLMELDGFQFEYIFDNKEDYDAYNEKYSEIYASKNNTVRAGGYNIYTSLDSEKQTIMQRAVDEQLSDFTGIDNETGKYKMQGAAVAVNNETGLVEVIVGGRGENDQFNRGFLAERQPGSAIKPLVAYGPAFETGRYYPSLIQEDSYIKNGPTNAYSGYIGNVSIREAIARSVNTIPYNILQNISPETGLDYLNRMRFTSLAPDDNVGSLALGGMTYGTTVVDMAKAFSTIANQGIYIDCTCITKLEYQNEGAIYDYLADTQKEVVYSEDAAYMLVDTLKGVLDSDVGTGRKLKLNSMSAFGKTGTTSSYKDGWFCGATPYYTVAVWCGMDTPATIKGLSGATYPGYIWKQYMDAVNSNLEYKDFSKPDTIITYNVNSNGKKTSEDTGRIDIFSDVLMEKENQDEEARQRAIWTRQEEANKTKETKVQASAQSAVSAYEKASITSTADIETIDKLYNEATNLVSQVNTYAVKVSLQQRVDIKKAELDILRQPYDSLLAQEKADEIAKQAAEQVMSSSVLREAVGLSKTDIAATVKQLLSDLENGNYSGAADYGNKHGECGVYLNMIKDSNEYSSLKSRYDSVSYKTAYTEKTTVVSTIKPNSVLESEHEETTQEETTE